VAAIWEIQGANLLLQARALAIESGLGGA
jgi:hypothetical protein